MIDIRRVSADDWQVVRDLRLTALRSAPEAYGSTYEREVEFDEATWRARTRTSAQFLALDGDRAVGLVAGFHDPDDCGPDDRLLVSMWVSPEARGTGAAPALIAAVAEWARTDGATALLLDVALDNERARRAYLRAGFVPTGHTREFRPGLVEEQLRLAL